MELGHEFLDTTKFHLGPDHLISLTAFAALASARAGSADGNPHPLGPDALVGIHAALGPDHPISLITAAAVTKGMAQCRDERVTELAADTLARAERVLGSNHPVTVGLLTTPHD